MLKRLLSHRFAPGWIVVVSITLSSPALFIGRISDDNIHRQMLRSTPHEVALQRAPYDLYRFIPGDAPIHRRMQEYGLLPWYASPNLKLSMFRPVSSLLLYFDEILCPNSTIFGHLHSLIWYGLLLFLLCRLYQTLMPTPWIANLAFLLYAIDDAHSFPVAWIANRNAVIAMTFASASLLFHIYWRRLHRFWMAAAAACLFLLGLFSSEMTLSIGAYMLAYAWFSEPSSVPIWPRMRSLLPYGMVTILWWLIYSSLSYGTHGSIHYNNPLTDPLHFLSYLWGRFLVLTQGQLTPIPAEAFFALPDWMATPWLMMTILILALIGMASYRWFCAQREMRFWLFGMLFSILPICSVFPHDRLLLPVGIGGFALIAVFIAPWLDSPEKSQTYAEKFLVYFFIVTHLFLAPITRPLKIFALGRLGTGYQKSARSLDCAQPLDHKTLMIVSGPDFFHIAHLPFTRREMSLSVPKRIRILGTTLNAIKVTRLDDFSLRIFAKDGLATERFDELLRYADTMGHKGDTFSLADITVRVLQITASKRPKEVIFTFSKSIDSKEFAWVFWSQKGYRPFPIPPTGTTVNIPAVSHREMIQYLLFDNP